MKHKRLSKRTIAILLSLLMIFSLAACSGQSGSQESDSPTESGSNEESSQPSNSGDMEFASTSNSGDTESTPTSNSGDTESTPPSNSDGSESQDMEQEGTPSSDETSASSNILVVYFSHIGENYSVGVIEKGNTHIIADMIAEETGADMFEIQPVNPYPDIYDECTDVAKQEQNNNAHPEFIGGVENMEQYDTVFIGYPIWWGDLPMIVYSFLENYDFSGKTVIPFCTHEGSGLSGTKHSIESLCSGATVLGGLAVRGSVAQNKQDEAKRDVLNWLNGLEY